MIVSTENVLQGNHTSCPVHCIRFSRALNITNSILSRWGAGSPSPSSSSSPLTMLGMYPWWAANLNLQILQSPHVRPH